jgi:ribosome-associated protein
MGLSYVDMAETRIYGKAHQLLRGCHSCKVYHSQENRYCFIESYKLYFKSSGEHKGTIMRITTEYIKLDSFLKAVNEVASGGEAKLLVTEGAVAVNGAIELRRGRKLRPGDVVTINGRSHPVEEGDADERA